MPTQVADATCVANNVNGNGDLQLEQLREQTRNKRTRIERLPPELLFYLSRFLDLASLIVLCTATCTRLRAIFNQFDRELLLLEPAHRLNLGEWREAARTLQSYGLGGERQPAPRPSKAGSKSGDYNLCTQDYHISQAMTRLTRDESLIDLDLFQSILKFLGPRGSSPGSAFPAHQPVSLCPTESSKATVENLGASKIRCLHLTGWHGMAGAFLIQQLRSQSCLRGVTTIVKTERADNRIWEQAAADDRKSRQAGQYAGLDSTNHHSVTAPSLRHTLRPGMWLPSGFDRAAEEVDFVNTLGFEKCTSTQIIVQVGKRRPRRHGQGYLRGEGLQMGYQGYCIDMMTTPMPHEVSADVSTIGTGERPDHGRYRDPEGRSEASGATVDIDTSMDTEVQGNRISSGRDNDIKRMHIVLLGREEVGTNMGDREQHEEMFERSIVTCNHCKDRISF